MCFDYPRLMTQKQTIVFGKQCWPVLPRLKADFLSSQKSLAYSLQIFVDNFSLLSPQQRVENFQLICYSKRVNAASQYNDGGSSRCSKWPNDRMFAVVKHCWLLVQGKRGCRERMTKDYCWTGVQENIGMFSKSWSDLLSLI